MLENAFTEWAAEQPASDPTDPAGIQHCLFCFDSLYFELNRQSHRGKNDEYLLNQLEDTIGATEFPLFVTWNIISNGGHPKLRGCIGNFAPSPLNEGLKDYAVISALKDHRFSPVTLADLKRLSCTVSLLHTFEDCATFTDWTIGPARSWVGQKRGHMMSATYLPDVASEQGWTKIEAIDSAIRKAGWKGSITPALRSSLIVERYQSSKHTATYQDWSDWREKLGFPL
ncbi:hypothetical protein KEM48_010269 [Puccinia striiformis f. sp. tritici PST-130]|nr:hypothetical protein KEM48_010269 [Puccinia striiformis f. sp. tritici PST-130]